MCAEEFEPLRRKRKTAKPNTVQSQILLNVDSITERLCGFGDGGGKGRFLGPLAHLALTTRALMRKRRGGIISSLISTKQILEPAPSPAWSVGFFGTSGKRHRRIFKLR